MNVLSLFSGIGGLELGLERAGMRTVGQVEIDPFCRKVLARHWPDVPRHDDVRTAREWWASEPRPRVDVVAGGYPCQPESAAGQRKGVADARWLWPEMARMIHMLRPRWVIGENVVGHRTGGLRFVLRDLGLLGYAARAGTIRASDVGAPHERARIFVLAHREAASHPEHGGVPEWARHPWRPAGERPPVGQQLGGNGQVRHMASPAPDTASRRRTAGRNRQRTVAAEPAGTDWWRAEPGVGRMAHGIPDRVDRVRALGNAVVPQVAEHIGRIVIAADRELFGDPVG